MVNMKSEDSVKKGKELSINNSKLPGLELIEFKVESITKGIYIF